MLSGVDPANYGYLLLIKIRVSGDRTIISDIIVNFYGTLSCLTSE